MMMVTIPKRISEEAMTKQVRSERKIPCQRTFAKDLDALRELSSCCHHLFAAPVLVVWCLRRTQEETVEDGSLATGVRNSSRMEEEEEVQARKRQRTGVGEGMVSFVWKKLFRSLSWLRTSSSSFRIGSSRVEETTTIACRGAASSVMEESSSMMIAQRIKQVVEDWRVQAVELEKERALVVDMEKKLSSKRDSLRHLTQQLETEREVNKILQAKFCRSRYELIQNEHKYILSAGKMQQKIHDMSLELKNSTKDKEFLQSEAEKGRRYCKDMQRELRKCRHSLTELKMVQRQQQHQMDIEEEQHGGRRPYAHKKKQQRLQENHRALKKRSREEESEEQQNAAAERRTKGRGDLSASQERRIDTKLLSQEPSSPADKRVTKAAASAEQRP